MSTGTGTSILEELRRIYDSDGEITAQAVVDAARPVDSVLHAHFEWDMAIGAEKYRLVQAQKMIQKMHLQIATGEPRGAVTVRAFLSVPPENADGRTGVYRSIEVVATDTELRTEIMTQMERDIAILRRKYRDHLAAFDELLRGTLGLPA